MTFAAAEHVGSLRLHPAGFARLEQRNQAPPDRCQRHLAKRRMRHAAHLENGRREIDESHRVGHFAAALGPAWPHDRQRDVYPKLQTVGLGPGEGHAVVRRDDNQRVVQFADFLELLQRPGQVRVEPLDLGVVVEDVAADFRCVRQEGRHVGVLKFPALLKADAFLENPVRLVAAQPKTERLAFGTLP